MNTAQAIDSNESISWKMWSVVALCAIVYFLDGLLPAMLGPLAPSIAKSLELGPGELGPVFSATIVGQSIGLVTMPIAARYIGHKSVIVLAVLGFGFMQAATYYAQSQEFLIAVRIIEGFFIGGGYPSCMVLVAAIVPQQRRGLAIMLLFAGLGLGSTMAGVVSRWFVADELWRIAFLVTGLIAMIMAVIVWRFLSADVTDTPEDPHKEPLRLRDIGRPPLLWGTLLLWTLYICSFTIFYCMTYWLPSLLVGMGRSPEVSAYAAASFNFGGLLALLIVGLLIDRYGAIRVLSIAYLLAAVLLFFDGRYIEQLSAPSLLVLLATSGFFMLGGYAGINVVLVNYYPPELRGFGAGWAKSAGRIGTISTPVLIGIALQGGIAEQTVLSSFAVPAAMAVAALWAISTLQPKTKGP